MSDLPHMEEDWQQCELKFNNEMKRSIVLYLHLSDINPLYIQEKYVNFVDLILLRLHFLMSDLPKME